MHPKTIRTIKQLAETSAEYITASYLSDFLPASTRQVLRYIKEAQAFQQDYGYQILSFKGRGYQLRITQKEKFQHFCGLPDGEKGNAPEHDLTQQVIKEILQSDGKKLDDLAEQFYYSRSGMSKVIGEVDSYLETFGLSLNSKAYTGLYIEGNEISIRDCMYHVYHTLSQGVRPPTGHELMECLGLEGIQLDDLLHWVDQCIKLDSLEPEEEEKRQFIQYLILTVARLSKGKEIYFGYLAHLDGKPKFQQQMFRISEFLNQYFPLQNLNGESIYLTLIWMQTVAKKGQTGAIDEHSMTFFHRLVMKALHKIKVNYGVDLSEDELLLNGLILHIASSYGKYLVHMESENPFYEELQKIYPTAYYYAIELAECIFEYTKLRMSDNELGFLIIYFASSIERNNMDFRVSAALLGNMTPGTALLLKSRLEKNYRFLDVRRVFNQEDLIKNKGSADFYISMDSTDSDTFLGKDLISLSPFLDQSDQEKINKVLNRLKHKSGIESVCREDCFFIWEKPMKKSTVLSNLCNALIQNGKMTEESKGAVLARENLVSTEISSLTAMPHCIIPGKSFLAFVLLKTPVMWGKTKVKLVILGGFQKGDTKIKEILEQLFLMVADDQKVNKLVSSKNYNEFFKYIKEFGGESLC